MSKRPLNPDVVTLRKARPYLRTLIAIVISFNKRTGNTNVQQDYERSDYYLAQLEHDVELASDEDPLQ